MLNDLVSVIIPVCNTNTRFSDCFASVLKQIYTNIEVILVDDGSSDESARICDAFVNNTDVFPVHVIHTKNGGVSRARNFGIDFANGKYIVFIDSDDQVMPNYISDFIDAREKYPDAGHIWCGFEYKSDKPERYLYSKNESFSIVSRDDYLVLYEKVLTQSPCLRIYDTSILKKNRIRMLEDLNLAEDIIFNLEYLDNVDSKIIYIVNNPNYIYYNCNTDSLRNKFRKDLFDIYEYYLKAMKLYLNKWGNTDPLTVSKFYNTVYYEFCAAMINTFDKSNHASFFEKIKTNNKILRHNDFVNALSNMDITISPALKKAYQTRNYLWVYLYKKLATI